MRIRAAILATAVLTLLAGCILAHYGVFNSTLTEDVTLEIRQLQSSGKFEGPERYKLGAGKKKRAVCAIAEVTATDSSGHVLFQQVLPGFRPEWDKFQKPGDTEVYYLVTRDGAYPIPVEWRENWKQHQKEIIADFDVKAARRRLLKEGILKE
ncbi:MAG: hypothetical protein NT154_41860 [Verrucomicrobia bacterium]|nr:hypothetical protein [Verrucomicrobiota bacterium]